jgi:hypothetical protein
MAFALQHIQVKLHFTLANDVFWYAYKDRSSELFPTHHPSHTGVSRYQLIHPAHELYPHQLDPVPVLGLLLQYHVS